MKNEALDVKENDVLNSNSTILEILLKDRTTEGNILWATDNYKHMGGMYSENMPIEIGLITGKNENVIKPRVAKAKEEQTARSREKAEVFTPSWMCNVQNNLIDEAWFGRKEVFNKETQYSWEAINENITFPEGKTWKDYIEDVRLEVSCGEAPYLVSRYDTVTGNNIKINERVGLLDRKLRVLNENVNSKEEWKEWAEKALKSIYGYEWQGDNLLIARENVLFTMEDYYEDKFNEKLEEETMLKFADIISWNLWQMDGVKFVVPNSCVNQTVVQMSLFDKITKSRMCPGCEKGNHLRHNGKQCKIMDWKKKKKVKYISLIGG